MGGKSTCEAAGGTQQLEDLLPVQLSSLPISEQQNQSSASCAPLGWELLQIPLVLLNVSSLGGNTAAALCNEGGVDDM